MTKVKYKGDLKERVKKEEQDELALHEIEVLEKASEEESFVEAKKEAKKRQEELENAKDAASIIPGKWNYANNLASYGNYLMSKIDEDNFSARYIPTDGSPIRVYGERIHTKEGIMVVMKYGEVYVKGFKPCGDADIDINAVEMLAHQVENTLDGLKGVLESDKSESGLIL